MGARFNFKPNNTQIQLALALSAASALIYEVVATHMLFFYFIESSYSVATVLSVFLLGLAVGSLLIYYLSDKIKNHKLFFGILQILIAVYAVFVLSNLQIILPKLSTLGTFITSFVLILAPTIFLGAIFPLAGSIFKKDKKDVIGLVYSSDLFGAIIGTLIAGFYLIPKLGARITVIFGAGLNIISAAIIMKRKQKIIPAIFFVFLIVGSINFAAITNEEPIIIPEPDYGEYQYYENSPYGLVWVKEDKLYIDSRIQCCWCYTDENSEVKMVNYSLDPIMKYNPKNALNIGLGCGMTLSKIVEYGLFADVVEINWKVVKANQLMDDILDNPKVNLIIDDGLHYLRENEKMYDSILIDIENPTIAHSSGLYTVDAFKLVNDSLNEHGTFGLWNYNGNERFLDILYYSMKEIFPYVYSRPGFFLASKLKLDLPEHHPTTEYEINTIDKNTLTDAYLNG